MGFMLEHNWPEQRNTHMSPFNHLPHQWCAGSMKDRLALIHLSVFPFFHYIHVSIKCTWYGWPDIRKERNEERKKNGLRESEFLWVCVGNPAELISVHTQQRPFWFLFSSDTPHPNSLSRLICLGVSWNMAAAEAKKICNWLWVFLCVSRLNRPCQRTSRHV